MSAAYEDEPPPFVRSWQPVDLADVLAGTWQPPEPTVGRRADGVGLFYPGKVHTLSSETEAGKTWLALSAAQDELTDGNHVLYLDFEDDEGGVVGRLLTLQVDADTIAERFHYVRPIQPRGDGVHADDLRAVLTTHRPTLAVVDGITEAMSLHRLNPLDNGDVASFGALLPRFVADHGTAVVCLDHVTKDREGRGRYSIGAAHKLNGLDGAAYVLESRTPFGVGLTGRSTLRIAKDRPGQLRRHALPSSGGMHWFGDLELTSHADEFAEAAVTVPHEQAADFRPTILMGRIAAALTEHGPLSQRKLLAIVKGNKTRATEALTFMQIDGYVSDRTPHELLKPYEPGDETP